MIAAMSAAALGSYDSGLACTPGANVELKWNAHASEWGAYEITGCAGVNPKLSLAAGTTYTFDQSDASNWYHPVGFAYIAGGAHTECRDAAGEMGECPELGGEDDGTTIQYYVDGVAVNDDESGFGLDAYEPLFFNSQDWWGEQAAFKVTLTIPVSAPYTKVYYFCHIHAGMSAEIEITGSAGGAILNNAMLGGETEESALDIYDTIKADHQKSIDAFDQTCGTPTPPPASTRTRRTRPARARTSSAVLAPATLTPSACRRWTARCTTTWPSAWRPAPPSSPRSRAR